MQPCFQFNEGHPPVMYGGTPPREVPPLCQASEKPEQNRHKAARVSLTQLRRESLATRRPNG